MSGAKDSLKPYYAREYNTRYLAIGTQCILRGSSKNLLMGSTPVFENGSSNM